MDSRFSFVDSGRAVITPELLITDRAREDEPAGAKELA